MEKLFTKATIEKSEKGLLAVASTAVEDRHGEVVEVSGWDLKNFKKNPVLLWAHDHTIPAIGVGKNIKVVGEGKKAQLTFEPVFHEATDFAKALKTMVEDGILNSFSVGFMPKNMDGNRYTDQELLEISLVNVPANPEARIMAYKSLEKAGFDKSIIDTITKADMTPEMRDMMSRAHQSASEAVNHLEDMMDMASSQNDDGMPKSMQDEVIEQLRSELVAANARIDDLVKGLSSLKPRVDRRESAELRVSMLKVVSRATDKLLEKKPQQPELAALKVIKRASDRLSHDLKRDLQSGKNKRTS